MHDVLFLYKKAFNLLPHYGPLQQTTDLRFLFPKVSSGISRKLSPKKTICMSPKETAVCMQCQSLFHGIKKNNILNCRLQNVFYPAY